MTGDVLQTYQPDPERIVDLVAAARRWLREGEDSRARIEALLAGAESARCGIEDNPFDPEAEADLFRTFDDSVRRTFNAIRIRAQKQASAPAGVGPDDDDFWWQGY